MLQSFSDGSILICFFFLCGILTCSTCSHPEPRFVVQVKMSDNASFHSYLPVHMGVKCALFCVTTDLISIISTLMGRSSDWKIILFTGDFWMCSLPPGSHHSDGFGFRGDIMLFQSSVHWRVKWWYFKYSSYKNMHYLFLYVEDLLIRESRHFSVFPKILYFPYCCWTCNHGM